MTVDGSLDEHLVVGVADRGTVGKAGCHRLCQQCQTVEECIDLAGEGAHCRQLLAAFQDGFILQHYGNARQQCNDALAPCQQHSSRSSGRATEAAEHHIGIDHHFHVPAQADRMGDDRSGSLTDDYRPKLELGVATSKRQPGFASQSVDGGCDLRLALAHRREQTGVVPERRVTVRVCVSGCALEGEKDHHHPPHQRFRLAEPVAGLQQYGEIVEVGRDPRMVLALAGLVDAQRAAHQRFASPSRLVACSNWARLLRSRVTFGWSLP
jgi:hypothetical protein